MVFIKAYIIIVVVQVSYEKLHLLHVKMCVLKFVVIFLMAYIVVSSGKFRVFAKPLQREITAERDEISSAVNQNVHEKEDKRLADSSHFTSKTGYKKHNREDLNKDLKHRNKYRSGQYDAGGKKQSSNSNQGQHYNEHQRGEKNHKAAKYGEKSGHKRGHKTKGYNNKFFRDEYHREHKFYDDFHKSGHHNKKGSNRENYENKSGTTKDLLHDNSGEAKNNYGKKGYLNKGFIDDEHAGYAKSKGNRQYHNNSNNHNRHKDSSRQKQYAVVEGK